ncbi:rCG46953 [Rattus norvegicus]|uniref:RCG46953 n=1 Tax=Rattus norvegicus TaxID=10116 RepID=A6IXW7_RAT|nr:rCG46953 [Rattus norvegicus]
MGSQNPGQAVSASSSAF